MLRGLGIFMVVWLHSAFYYFDGLYDLDLDNPPPIVTLIGLLLMFAGLFAIISGVSHTLQLHRKKVELGFSNKSLFKYNSMSAVLVLVIAYTYFIFAGPGLVDMKNRSMNNSIFVDLIRNGIFKGFNLDRILYVDSLVMIGLNIFLLGSIFFGIQKTTKAGEYKKQAGFYLGFGLVFFVLSLIRVFLYDVYLNALAEKNYGWVLILNWLVNKNNPILPYLSFGLFGAWIATLLIGESWKTIVRKVIPISLVLLVIGIFLYVKLPDTMLERSIDFKWFAIMTAQLGLFMLMLLFALRIFDFSPKTTGSSKKMGFLTKFIYRFGIAGLTAFFFESIVSACIYRVLTLIVPNLKLNLVGSLVYGFALALSWGVALMLWEKKQYKFGLEYWYCRILLKFGGSEKQNKLMNRM
jgi:hypothetical protein